MLPFKKSIVLPAFLLLILFCLCVHFAATTGQTTDETFYNGSGYPMVRYNNYEFLGEHPPLIIQLGALPLLFVQPKFPIQNPILLPGSNAIDISRTGAVFLYEMGNDPQQILFLERLSVIFLTLFLGFGIFRLGREIYGAWGALLALFLYVFSPNVIGNGSLYMTDMGLTVFYFFSIYAVKRFFDKPSAKRAIVLGVACGLTFMSKISGLILFPILTALFLLFYFSRSQTKLIPALPDQFDKWMGFLALFLLINAIGQKQAMVSLGPICLLTVYLSFKTERQLLRSRWMKVLFHGLLVGGIFLCFFFSFKLKKKYGVGGTAFLTAWNITMVILWAALAKFRNDVLLGRLTKLFLAVWLVAGLVIVLGYTDIIYKCYRFIGFGNYVKPLGITLSHSLGGHKNCFDGSFITCDWRYFFSVMAVQTPLLVLGLSSLGFFFLLHSKLRFMIKSILLIPVVLFLGAALFNKINIGLRHILPVFPFLFLWGGFPGAALANMRSGILKKVLIAVLSILLALFALRTFRIAPHYLTYFNEAIGGAEEGAKLMPVNWGEDNKHLAEFVRMKKIPFIKISSDAANPDIYDYYKIPWETMKESEWRAPTPGFYALGIGIYIAQQKSSLSWFRGKQPLYRIGKTFYVFEVPEGQTPKQNSSSDQ